MDSLFLPVPPVITYRATMTAVITQSLRLSVILSGYLLSHTEGALGVNYLNAFRIVIKEHAFVRKAPSGTKDSFPVKYTLA